MNIFRNTKVNRNANRTHLSLEALEAREVLNSSFSLVSKTLYVYGTESADRVEITRNGDYVRASHFTSSYGEVNQWKDGKIDAIVFYGGGGNDSFVNQTNNRVYAYGGAGDDYLVGGSLDDVLFGHEGNDYIFGGNGNDWIAGFDGNDTLEGGSGNDRLEGIVGNDLLRGHAGNDYLHGGPGDDYIEAGAGNDTGVGDVGNDVFYGEDGHDYFTGDSGDDRAYGGRGNDTLIGGDGNDGLDGHEGDDYVSGGAGTDWVGGSAGNDMLLGGADWDWLYGYEGDDVLFGGSSGDYLNGGPGVDRLNASPNDIASDPDYSAQTGYGLIDANAAVSAVRERDGYLPSVANRGGKEWNLDMVNAPDVWAQGITGSGVVVAVLDTGVDYTNPDLDSNIWRNAREVANDGIDNDGNGYIDDVHGWDFVGRDNDPDDTHGHGTHVAGTIAAENNGIGITGVAPGAKIMPVRVLGGWGDIAGGIRYAVDNGADVINMSLLISNPASSSIRSAIQYASDNGVIVVSAAGNWPQSSGYGYDNQDVPTYPARYAENWGMAVGAVKESGALTDFSHRAGATQLDYVTAPGKDVWSIDITQGEGKLGAWSGTSMASPHVAGVAALLLQANPNLTSSQVENVLKFSANPAHNASGATGSSNASYGSTYYGSTYLSSQAAVAMEAVSRVNNSKPKVDGSNPTQEPKNKATERQVHSLSTLSGLPMPKAPEEVKAPKQKNTKEKARDTDASPTKSTAVSKKSKDQKVLSGDSLAPKDDKPQRMASSVSDLFQDFRVG